MIIEFCERNPGRKNDIVEISEMKEIFQMHCPNLFFWLFKFQNEETLGSVLTI